MSRPILLSNGELHVGINRYGEVHDFYYPYVGLENHAAAKRLRHRIGVHIEGSTYWLDDAGWNISFGYFEGSLISHIVAEHAGIGVRLEFDDCVIAGINAFVRNVHVINLRDIESDIRIFFHQVFVISDSHMSDTVQYVPGQNVIMHYKGHRTFYVNAMHADGKAFDDYSVGLFGIEGRDGTFRDADDGVLTKNGVEHGRVDSVIGLYMRIPAKSSHRVYYWVACGKSESGARQVNDSILKDGALHYMLATAKHWSVVMRPVERVVSRLPMRYHSSFRQSALLVLAAIDKRGAVIASTDTTMLNYSRDSYAYCWPRDAVYVLWPLMRMGFTNEIINFFAFVRRVKHADGYLSHKYQADGALGSSWHPYTHENGLSSPPIQTDETAGVVFLFGQYHRMHDDKELLENYYYTLVKPLSDFLASFIGDDNLPLPSYDLWEQKYLTTTYTTALTYAALIEAVRLAEINGDKESAVWWQTVADDIHSARDIFYDEQLEYFIKGFGVGADGTYYDKTIDSSSLYGVFMYGYFDTDDHRVTQAYKTMRRELVVDEVAVVRYRDDDYHRSSSEIANPWPVTSLWFAQYELEHNNHKYAEDVLDWVGGLMMSSGAIAEQYIPHSNEYRSVNPLSWSQSEYLNVLLDYASWQDDKTK